MRTEFSRLVGMIELAHEIDRLLSAFGLTFLSLDITKNADLIIDNPHQYMPGTDHRVRRAVVKLVREWRDLRSGNV